MSICTGWEPEVCADRVQQWCMKLWAGEQTLCLAGPMGDDARRMLGPTARLVWTVEAESHFEVMTIYYEHMGWGTFTSDFPDVDRETYGKLRAELSADRASVHITRNGALESPRLPLIANRDAR